MIAIMDDDLFGEPKERHEQAYLPLDLIIPNDWNANEQDERTFDAFVDDVAETGFIDSLTVVPIDDGTYRIIGGEHRWRAAKASGEDEVPCLILKGAKWADEDLQKFVTVRLNMFKGKLNPEKFAKLYREMADKYGKEQLQKLFGFTDKRAFKKILSGVTKAAKQALPKELHGDLDEKAKDAQTVEDLGNIVQEMFQKYGDTADKSFMIFTHGKQEHIYVAMSTDMRRAMDKVCLYCETVGMDINEFMAPVTKACLEEAMKGLDQLDAEDPQVSEDDPF
jgi:hypothetical protein